MFIKPGHIRSDKFLPFILTMSMVMPIGCSVSEPFTDIERAAEFSDTDLREEDGHPELRLTAMGYLDEEDDGIIHITADIENRSLIYRHLNEITSADIELDITVVGTGEERHINSYKKTKTIRNDTYGHIIIADITRVEKELIVPPGRYKVFFSVTDQASGSKTIREIYATVPDPDEEIVSVTPIQLFLKNSTEPDTDYEPLTSYSISSEADSIRFAVQVANNQSEEPLVLRSQLIRFESDSTVARSLSHPNYSTSSLPYLGIDYRREESLEETRRTFDQPGVVMVEFQYKRPDRGNYRFVITAEKSGEEEELFRGRDFSVKGENFPRVQSPRELAEPLVYLMRNSEYEKLMAIEDPEKMKAAVDRFWLENAGSVNRARQIIKLYYERVEEANMKFSSFKEGWKTDRGMVYILFGPPARIEQWVNMQQWLGSYQSRDTRYNFHFRRTRIRNNYFPFDNYILQRSQAYHNYQYQQIQLWRTGGILNATM